MFKKSRLIKRGVSSLILVSGLFVAPLVFALGDDVNNGGGVAERTILYAYSKLEPYIKLCLSAETCKLKSGEAELLTKILNALPDEYANTEQIRFASEKDNPGTFLINGEIKAAKTGNKIGSPIYFNRDLFASKTIHNTFEPISLSNAVSLLVHEMGHHHPSKFQEADLDLLGIKVSILLDQEINQTPVFPNNRNINAIVINDKVKTFYPEVLLYIGEEVFDVSEKLKDALFCPKAFLPNPLPDPENPIPVRKPTKVIYYNIHWDTFAEANGQGIFQILGNLIMDCGDETKDKSHQAKISFNVRMEDKKWKLVERSILAQQYYKPWWKIIDLPFFETKF
jgi:hypothetical protein